MIWIIIVIVLLVIFWYTQLRVSVDKFDNVLPRERFPDIVKEFGNPDMLFNIEGGFAVWKRKSFFEKIILKDESIAHFKPRPHCDFLYATIRVYLPGKSRDKILDLSPSIYYDELKRELTARCDHMGPNVASLYLAMKLSEDGADHNKYKDMYDETIMSSKEPTTYANLSKQLESMINENHILYSAEMAKIDCPTK